MFIFFHNLFWLLQYIFLPFPAPDSIRSNENSISDFPKVVFLSIVVVLRTKVKNEQIILKRWYGLEAVSQFWFCIHHKFWGSLSWACLGCAKLFWCVSQCFRQVELMGPCMIQCFYATNRKFSSLCKWQICQLLLQQTKDCLEKDLVNGKKFMLIHVAFIEISG